MDFKHIPDICYNVGMKCKINSLFVCFAILLYNWLCHGNWPFATMMLLWQLLLKYPKWKLRHRGQLMLCRNLMVQFNYKNIIYSYKVTEKMNYFSKHLHSRWNIIQVTATVARSLPVHSVIRIGTRKWTVLPCMACDISLKKIF